MELFHGKDYIGMTKDSSISYKIGNMLPGEKKKISIFIYAKENSKGKENEEIIKDIQDIKKLDITKEYNSVKKYWRRYVEKYYNLKGEEYSEKIYQIYIRTILLFPLLTNSETGGIIASLEVDENKEKSGGYGYCWTRDAVFITKALDLLGMTKETEKFYNTFCKMTQSGNGMWEQRFYTDLQLAPCWGYQIDETASVIYGIYEHYKYTEQRKFLKENLRMCEKAVKFLIEYIKYVLNIDEEDVVKKEIQEKLGNNNPIYKIPSYDLWEMNEGVHLYSLSCIYAAFNAMIEIYDEIKEDYITNRIRLEKIEKRKQEMDEYKAKIKEYIEKNMYNDKQNVLVRNTKDEYTDISTIGCVVPFEVFETKDKKVTNMIEKINMTLRTYSGGYLRFENDSYMGGGNPWPISNLWMAMYHIKNGNFELAIECLNFVVNTSTEHGFLAEQVDNKTLKSNWVIGLGWSHAMYIIILMAIDGKISF